MAGDSNYLAKDLERYTRLEPKEVHTTGRRWLNLKTGVRIDISPKATTTLAPGDVKGGK